jgi:hypothetical protein
LFVPPPPPPAAASGGASALSLDLDADDDAAAEKKEAAAVDAAVAEATALAAKTDAVLKAAQASLAVENKALAIGGLGNNKSTEGGGDGGKQEMMDHFTAQFLTRIGLGEFVGKLSELGVLEMGDLEELWGDAGFGGSGVGVVAGGMGGGMGGSGGGCVGGGCVGGGCVGGGISGSGGGLAMLPTSPKADGGPAMEDLVERVGMKRLQARNLLSSLAKAAAERTAAEARKEAQQVVTW